MLSAELDRARDDCSGDVRVDMAAVTFFDSSAVRVLLHAHGELTERRRRIVVVDPAPKVQRVFELTGLVGMFQLEVSQERD